jgi:hypothetical protein
MFTKFVQGNVSLAARGDITVDATLMTGDFPPIPGARTPNKDFSVTQRIRFQLHINAFNALNNMNYNNPNKCYQRSVRKTHIYYIYSQDFGRHLQLGLRLAF